MRVDLVGGHRLQTVKLWLEISVSHRPGGEKRYIHVNDYSETLIILTFVIWHPDYPYCWKST